MKHIFVENCGSCPRCYGKLTGSPWCAELSTNDETFWIAPRRLKSSFPLISCPLPDYKSDNADRYKVDKLETAIKEVLNDLADLSASGFCTLDKLKKAMGQK